MKKMKSLVAAITIIAVLFTVGCKKKTDPIPTPIDTAIKDASGNVYTPITIGTQVWLKENLRTTKYANGDDIFKESSVNWATLTAGAYCYYENLTSNAEAYGNLYNGFAVTDPRGIAPKGYHVATQADWETLITAQGGFNAAAGRLKEQGPIHWDTTNSATNSTGFSALGGGSRRANVVANYLGLGIDGFWWTTTASNSLLVGYTFTSSQSVIEVLTFAKTAGLSVRCVKD